MQAGRQTDRLLWTDCGNGQGADGQLGHVCHFKGMARI